MREADGGIYEMPKPLIPRPVGRPAAAPLKLSLNPSDVLDVVNLPRPRGRGPIEAGLGIAGARG